MFEKKTFLIIAIAVVFAFFIGYGIEVFDPSPIYEDFCPSFTKQALNQSNCQQQNGTWIASTPDQNMGLGYCEQSPACYEALTKATSKHDKIVFIISIIAGLIGIIVGIILKKEIVGTGLVGGGVLLILYGTIRYWQHAHNTLKFILLGAALIILIWLGYKKFEKK